MLTSICLWMDISLICLYLVTISRALVAISMQVSKSLDFKSCWFILRGGIARISLTSIQMPKHPC